MAEKKKGSGFLIFIIIIDLLLFPLLAVGEYALFYPTVSDTINYYKEKKLLEEYERVVAALHTEQSAADELEKAREYNTRHKVNTLIDAFNQEEEEEETDIFSSDYLESEEEPAEEEGASGDIPEYETLLNVAGNGIMGSIKIPKITLELPIYHYVSEDVLSHGVGHLPGTSLPVGGEGSHAVLSGHRGLPSARLFTDLDKIETGDLFYLTVLDETLAYEVDQILTVLPHEVEALDIEEGSDLVTLITCTPYGVNTHRLLIRGRRTEMPEEVVEENIIEEPVIFGIPVRMAKVAAIGIGTLIIVIILLLLLCKDVSRLIKGRS